MLIDKRQLGQGAGLLVALGLAFAWGRTSAPVHYVERTETHTVAEVQAHAESAAVTTATEAARTRTVYVYRRAPSGAVEVRKTTTTETAAEVRREEAARADVAAHVETVETRSVEVTRGVPGWRLQLDAGWSRLQQTPTDLGLGLSRRLVGPIWVGASLRREERGSAAWYVPGLSIGVEW